MRLVSTLIVVFALVLAGVVFFVVPRLLNRGAQEAQQQAQQPPKPAFNNVLVAAHSLPAGLILRPEDLRWQRWPSDALDPSFLVQEKGSDPQKDAVGRVVLHGIETGEPVTQVRLLKPGDAGFLAAALTPGMRAFSIRIDVVSGTGGFILPEDRVDILLTEKYNIQALSATPATQSLPQVLNKDITSVVLRNVRVLAVDQVMQDIDSKPKVAATATLEVDLTQAEKLALAGQLGSLSLALRSHTVPAHPEAEIGSGMVEDFQVSPFRAAVLQKYYSILAAEPRASQAAGGLRVYHGGLLAAGQ